MIWAKGRILRNSRAIFELNEDIGTFATVKVTYNNHRIMVNLFISGYFEAMWHS